jgi:hypothetical protein
VVVHNAGNRQNAYFEALTDEQVQSVLAVHLLGAFRLLSPVWPVMQANHYGRVVLIGSSVGAYGMEGISNYGAAKAGLIGLTKSLALEGGDHGILVNCVLPQADTAATSGRPKGRTLVSRASQEVASARARMGSRVGAELVAPLVSFLASRQCEVTGEVFSGSDTRLDQPDRSGDGRGCARPSRVDQEYRRMVASAVGSARDGHLCRCVCGACPRVAEHSLMRILQPRTEAEPLRAKSNICSEADHIGPYTRR